MKAVKFFLLLALFTSAAFVHAYSGDPKSDEAVKEELKKEIISFLKKPNLVGNDVKPCKVNVHFVINSKKQVRVIDIYTSNEYLKNFIENRLDNKEIKTEDVELKKTYLIPIKFELS